MSLALETLLFLQKKQKTNQTYLQKHSLWHYSGERNTEMRKKMQLMCIFAIQTDTGKGHYLPTGSVQM